MMRCGQGQPLFPAQNILLPRYPLRQVLGYGGFRRNYAHSCRSARYGLIVLGLRLESPNNIGLRCLAEREGFEPPIALRLCLISSQV
jgi:hypothetical protein